MTTDPVCIISGDVVTNICELCLSQCRPFPYWVKAWIRTYDTRHRVFKHRGWKQYLYVDPLTGLLLLKYGRVIKMTDIPAEVKLVYFGPSPAISPVSRSNRQLDLKPGLVVGGSGFRRGSGRNTPLKSKLTAKSRRAKLSA